MYNQLVKVAAVALCLNAFVSAAFAHAPLTLRFPIGHVGVSGANQASLTQLSTITRAGYSNGLNISLSKALQGQVASGQLTGAFSQQISGNSYLSFNNFTISLNQLGGTAPSTVNSIIFVPPGKTQATGIAGFVRTMHTFPHSLSVSQMLAQKQLHYEALSSTSAGLKAGQAITSSPIVAGEFFGGAYLTSNTSAPFTYNGAYKFVYGFGSDPLNFSSLGFNTLNPSTFRNYIQLANGQVYTYSSGLLSGSTFLGSTFVTQRLLAIGNNPYNFFNSSAAASSFSAVFSKFPLSYLLR